MRSLAVLSAAALLLTACTTVDPRDWKGDPGANPFDEAASQCRGQRMNGSDPQEGQAAFTLCMNQKGWSRR